MSVTELVVLGSIPLVFAVLFLWQRHFGGRSRDHGDTGAYTGAIISSDGGSSCATGDGGGSCDGGGGGGGGGD